MGVTLALSQIRGNTGWGSWKIWYLDPGRLR